MKTSTFFQRYRELGLGIAMLALAAFYLHHASLIRIRSSVRVDARLVPQALGTLVVVLGVLQIAAGIRRLAAARKENREERIPEVFLSAEEKRIAKPVSLTFAIIFGYALLFDRLGFIIASTLCMFLQMLVLAPKGRARPLFFFAIAAAAAVVVYIAFRKGLNLSLPQGVLDR